MNLVSVSLREDTLSLVLSTIICDFEFRLCLPDINEKTIRVISFSGTKSDWRVWSCKFLAQANRLGHKDLLEGKGEIPKEFEYDPAKIKSNSPTDDKKYLIEQWKLYEELSVSETSLKVAFNLIENCAMTDQPNGNSHT